MSAKLRAQRGTAGFTLVELLITMSLIGVVMGALVLALQAMMTQTTASQTRVEVSNDAQIAAAYFAEDVASIGVRNSSGDLVQSVETNAPATGGLYPCGPSSLPNAKLRLAWDELTDGPTEVKTRVIVSYVVVPSGSERQLRRIVCRGGATASLNEGVAHNVSTATAPTVTCSSTCTDAPPPKRVTLNLTIAQPSNSDVLAVTLTGQRRQT